MAIPRVYQPMTLAIQTLILLDEKASHHLGRVLRLRLGDEIRLFNGQGGEYQAVIKQMDKKGVKVQVLTFLPQEVESPIQIDLAQGIARGEKMDFIVQKAVELGVNHIIPLMTERSQVKWDADKAEKRLSHWQSVVYSACEQSGRNRVPCVSRPTKLKDWLPQVQADRCFILSPYEQHTLESDSLPVHARIVLLIGPEGGFTAEENDLAQQHGFLPLNLGPRILRTETASLAAIATLQYRYGDFALTPSLSAVK